MLSHEERDKIEQKYQKVRETAKYREKELFSVMDSCTEEEAWCMKYLYAYMTTSDLADYTGELFLQFVRQALMVREKMSWGSKIPDAIFLNYVLQYRINNENIEFYKDIFFNEISKRIEGLSMYEAAIAVNYWSFEKATYQTTDDRTASPLTVLRNAYGRCGEESTLAVSALRSVGIPARQCYAPRWSHCDDNHAWVEVWIDGKWDFLGACEPEIKLNRGWFRYPASKAMLIHNRIYSDIAGDELVTLQTDRLSEINVLSHYAKIKEITVKVTDIQGNPVTGASVGFEVVNYSEFFPIATLTTDVSGEVHFTTGLGDLFIFAYKGDQYIFKMMNVREESSLTLELGRDPEEGESFYFAMIPPTGGTEEEEALTEEEQKLQQKRKDDALKLRQQYEDTFYSEEKGLAYAENYPNLKEKIASCLKLSRGNYEVIRSFFDQAVDEKEMSYRIDMLLMMRKKDLTDITNETLSDHFDGAMRFADQILDSEFKEGILCPRIYNEMITPFRHEILEILTEDQKESFHREPKTCYDWIQKEIKEDKVVFNNLYTTPMGTLTLQIADKKAKDILFVAIMRTLGVPSKLQQSTKKPMYFKDGDWNILQGEEAEPVNQNARLTLVQEPGTVLEYYKNYTIAQLVDGHFVTLDYTDLKFESEKHTFMLEPGYYWVVTANRQTDESNLIKVYTAELKSGQETEIIAALNHQESSKNRVTIPDRAVQEMNGTESKLYDEVGDNTTILAWLQVGAEPTEHLLNELIEDEKKLNEENIPILLVLTKPEEENDPTLKKAMALLPNIKLIIEREFDIDGLYESFGLPDKKLPLGLAVREDKTAENAWAGYYVGIGQMLLKSAKK